MMISGEARGEDEDDRRPSSREYEEKGSFVHTNRRHEREKGEGFPEGYNFVCAYNFIASESSMNEINERVPKNLIIKCQLFNFISLYGTVTYSKCEVSNFQSFVEIILYAQEI